MNKSIKIKRVVDHIKTERALKEIMKGVKRQGIAYLNYINKKDESKDQSMYSATYLKGFSDKALEQLVAVAKENSDKFTDLLEEAKAEEFKNDDIPLDITNPELQGATAIINAMGEKIDFATFDSIVRPFIGRSSDLKFIKTMLDKYNYQIPDSAEKYFYDTRLLFDELDNAINLLTGGPDSIVPYAMVQKEVVEVACLLGIELSDSDLDMGIPADSAWFANMQLAAGLDYEEVNREHFALIPGTF